MSERKEPVTDRENQLGEAVAWYYQSNEAGNPPTPSDFLARYPDLRSELESFLADKEAFNRFANPRPDPDATLPPAPKPETADYTPTSDQTATLPPSKTESVTNGTLGSIRYFGDYELLAEIARGGMGVVFRARQVSLNREVALKMILTGQLASAADVARFHSEAESAANLDHPNILPIYEIGEHLGQHYFSMKLINGGSLAGKVAEFVKDPKAAVAMLVKVCRAVDFAHKRGTLHRDLKPGNILLDADGTPYVTDFGLAKKVEGDSNLTQSGAIVGTPSYMAPEQARAEKGLSTGVDVYALGAILYELLTGQPPFRGPTVLDTILQVLEKEPVDPRAVNPKADRDPSLIALKCLGKETGKRYESASALADDLERWSRGEAIQARPVGRGEKTMKWVRRNPVITSLLALLAVAMIAGGTSTVFYAIQSGRRADAAAASELEARTNEATANDRQEMLKDTLCSASYQQANALRLAGRPGWRKKALELLTTAAELRRRPRDPNDDRVNLPALADIRGEAIMALLRLDVDPLEEIRAGWLYDFVVSLDGHVIAQPYLDTKKAMEHTGGIEIFDLTTGRAPRRLEMKGDRDLSWAVTIKAMNANGTQLACAPGSPGIIILDTVSGKIVVNLKESGKVTTLVGRVRFSPDGRRIAAVCVDENEARLQIWDIDKPLAPRMLSSHPLPKSDLDLTTPEDGLFGCLRFSPDSRRLSYIAPGGKGVRVVDLSIAPPAIAHISFPEGVTAAEWHPSGRRLGVVLQMGRNTRKVVQWDLEHQKIGPVCDTPLVAPATVAFSPDGRCLAVSSASETVVVYGADDSVERYRIEEAAGEIVRRLFWTSEGRLVTAGMMENLRVWQPSSDSLPVETVYRVKASGGFAASGDGRWLALFADSDAVVADPVLAKNAEIAPLADLDAMSQVLRKRDLATLIDRSTGQVVQTWPVAHAETNRLHFSPDGRLLVAFTPEGAVVWDIVSRKEMLRRKSPDASTLGVWEAGGFDLEGRLIGVSSKLLEETVGKNKSNLPDILRVGRVSFEVWDLLNNKLMSTISNIEKKVAHGLSKLELFSSGRSLLVCPFRTNPIGAQEEPDAPWEVYALPSGEIQVRYPHFSGKGMQAFPGRVSQDGRLVLVASVGMDLNAVDGLGQWTTRVHDLRTGAEVLSLPVNNMFAIEAIDFSPDGNVLARAVGQGFAEVWDMTKKELLFRWQPFEGRPVRDITFTQNGDIAAVGKLSDHVPILQMGKLRPRLAVMGLDW